MYTYHSFLLTFVLSEKKTDHKKKARKGKKTDDVKKIDQFRRR